MTAALPLRKTGDIALLLESTPGLRDLLEIVASLDLPDGWIGAGFVRNPVWDVLHGRPPRRRPDDDVDVVFLDPSDSSEGRDRAIESRLRALAPEAIWQVKNQARMHRRNGDRPYRDTQDAIAHWPETATAIAARLHEGRIEIIAPHGVEDLLDLRVRPTPAFEKKMGLYRDRLKAKDWPRRWPRLGIDRREQACPTVP